MPAQGDRDIAGGRHVRIGRTLPRDDVAVDELMAHGLRRVPREELLARELEHEVVLMFALVAGLAFLDREHHFTLLGELDSVVGQVAKHLRQSLRIADHPGIEQAGVDALVVAVFGVLKAGAAYVPLDPAYPEERLAFMARRQQTQK